MTENGKHDGERWCSQCGWLTTRYDGARGAVICMNCEVEMRYGTRQFVPPKKAVRV